mgnify:CR=1 FL=1
MSVILQVTVHRPPAKEETFAKAFGGRHLQVTEVTGIYMYRDGGWTGKPRFSARGRRIRKDGTLGVDLQRLEYNWEPDQETREQFAQAAERIVRQAAKDA